MAEMNRSKTLYASAARTASPAAEVLHPQDHKGILIVVDVTALAATPAVTPQIRVKDENGDFNEVIWQAAAAITNVTGVGEYSYLIYPGAIAADFDGTEAVGIPLPLECDLLMSHVDADSITYSVRGHYLK